MAESIIDNSLQEQINDLNGKFGSTAMGTSADTVTGAIKEHEDDITKLKSQILAVRFSDTPSNKTTGNKTKTVTIPSGYSLLTNHPFGIQVSGNATVTVPEASVSLSGTTATVTYYLYNPSSSTATVIITGDVMVKRN